jgi:hypothetical protein
LVRGLLYQSVWSRIARRDGVDRFTVAGLACFGLHEAHHDLLDAEGRLNWALEPLTCNRMAA